VILEESRNEVCFKTGLVGFHITCIFYTICEMIEKTFKKNYTKLCSELDANFGCLSENVENSL
jgi:hypothetical protein